MKVLAYWTNELNFDVFCLGRGFFINQKEASACPAKLLSYLLLNTTSRTNDHLRLQYFNILYNDT